MIVRYKTNNMVLMVSEFDWDAGLSLKWALNSFFLLFCFRLNFVYMFDLFENSSLLTKVIQPQAVSRFLFFFFFFLINIYCLFINDSLDSGMCVRQIPTWDGTVLLLPILQEHCYYSFLCTNFIFFICFHQPKY